MDEIKASLFVATPMYGGMCTGLYTVGLLNTPGVLGVNKITMQYAMMQNESLITRARNSLTYDFLASECTHLMFIDADIGFNPKDIISMVDADKDIVCGMYPKKEIDWNSVSKAVERGVPPDQLHRHTAAPVVNFLNDAKEQAGVLNQLIQIDNGGTGFMLIKRNVFEFLKDKVPTYTNDMFFAVDQERKVKVIYEFFATSIDEPSNRLLSEDYHFCKLARQNGFQVWAAPWVKLTHTGTYNFNGNLERC